MDKLTELIIVNDAELQIYSPYQSDKLYAFFIAAEGEYDFGPYTTIQELTTEVNKEVTQLVEQNRDNTNSNAGGTGDTGQAST